MSTSVRGGTCATWTAVSVHRSSSSRQRPGRWSTRARDPSRSLARQATPTHASWPDGSPPSPSPSHRVPGASHAPTRPTASPWLVWSAKRTISPGATSRPRIRDHSHDVAHRCRTQGIRGATSSASRAGSAQGRASAATRGRSAYRSRRAAAPSPMRTSAGASPASWRRSASTSGKALGSTAAVVASHHTTPTAAGRRGPSATPQTARTGTSSGVTRASTTTAPMPGSLHQSRGQSASSQKPGWRSWLKRTTPAPGAPSMKWGAARSAAPTAAPAATARRPGAARSPSAPRASGNSAASGRTCTASPPKSAAATARPAADGRGVSTRWAPTTAATAASSSVATDTCMTSEPASFRATGRVARPTPASRATSGRSGATPRAIAHSSGTAAADRPRLARNSVSGCQPVRGSRRPNSAAKPPPYTGWSSCWPHASTTRSKPASGPINSPRRDSTSRDSSPTRAMATSSRRAEAPRPTTARRPGPASAQTAARATARTSTCSAWGVVGSAVTAGV